MFGCPPRLAYAEQKRILRMIPALHEAEFLRFGSFHRNTFIDSPNLLGDELELLLEGEFIQRRGRISVVASTDPPIEEIDHANNRLAVVLEPDLDNDLGIANAVIVSGRGLVVTVRNNSPIPIVGTIAIEVRQTRDDTLLARRSVQIELQPEAIVEVVFESIEQLDCTRTTVELS